MKEKEPRSEQEKQTTDSVVMIYPDTFKFNPETYVSNGYQKKLGNLTQEQVNLIARKEFENEVKTLRENGINVMVLHSVDCVETPDAVFPNNWLSFHNKKLVLYSMRNENRSAERQPENLIRILKENGIEEPEIIDLSYHEKQREIKDGFSVCTEALEGTGSLVLDRVNKIAYATESVRTTKKVFDEWCSLMGYQGVFFHATAYKEDEATGQLFEDGPVYHTNVVMGIGEKFAVVCLESIKDDKERRMVHENLQKSGREIIEISNKQVNKYCGNVIELRSTVGEPIITMSKTSYDAFTTEQKIKLEGFGKVIRHEIPVIETIGGGSIRCTIAEVY